MSGIGKASVNRLKYHYDKWFTHQGPYPELPLVTSTQYLDLLHYIAERNHTFIAICKSWTGDRPPPTSLTNHSVTPPSSYNQDEFSSEFPTLPSTPLHWSKAYWDAHHFRPILKVDSHQLNRKNAGIAL